MTFMQIGYKNPSPFDEEANRRLIERSMDMQERLQKTFNEMGNQRIVVSDPWGVRGLHPVLVVGLVLMLLAAIIYICVQCCRRCKRPSQEIHVPAPTTPAPASDPVTAPVSAPAGYVVVPQHPPSYNAPPCPPAYDSVCVLPGPGQFKPARCKVPPADSKDLLLDC